MSELVLELLSSLGSTPKSIFCETWFLMFSNKSGAYCLASFSNLARAATSTLARLSIVRPKFLSLKVNMVPMIGIVINSLWKCSTVKAHIQLTHLLTFFLFWQYYMVSLRSTMRTSRLLMTVFKSVAIYSLCFVCKSSKISKIKGTSWSAW